MAQYRGLVKWFNSAKGFGFLSRKGGSDVFCHFTSIVADGTRGLREGDPVSFDVIEGQQGPQADNVRRLHIGKPSTEQSRAIVREVLDPQREVA